MIIWSQEKRFNYERHERLKRGKELEELSELEASSEWGKEKIVAIFCFHLPALFLFYSSLLSSFYGLTGGSTQMVVKNLYSCDSSATFDS